MKNRLHLYCQSHPHDPAFIVADREALEALRAAIEVALASNVGSTTTFDEIGEGYDLVVILNETDEMQPPYDYNAVAPWGRGPYDLVTFDRDSQQFKLKISAQSPDSSDAE